ncbi:carbonic anhydrase family protein [Oenococcus oeni]|uniref:carbonic anhydrase family protein n=1 Tax=Oenococcus oeni TaxID=1247 RepID=UPI000277BCCB|nr:carbonic anhydrase family protein [Oenococcus oeni]EJO07202.1 carbonic anhydrase [Oenococcus oeni AWRIB553]
MPKLDYDNQNNWLFKTEQMQSPVALESNKAEKIEKQATLKLNYSTNASYVHDNGQGIEIGLSGKAIIDNRFFSLQQFHIHAPSEHLLNNYRFDGEIHFVHQAKDGRTAVIAVFLKAGKTSKTFSQIFNHLNQDQNFVCDLTDLIPENKSYYHYLGSLTTPPLTENVEWYILANPVEISRQQLAEFHKLYPYNNRQLQSLNGRPVLYCSSTIKN